MHAMVVSIDHVQSAERVSRDSPGLIKFARLAAVASPAAEIFPLERELLHAMIAKLTEIDAAPSFIEMQIVRIAKQPRHLAM